MENSISPVNLYEGAFDVWNYESIAILTIEKDIESCVLSRGGLFLKLMELRFITPMWEMLHLLQKKVTGMKEC